RPVRLGRVLDLLRLRRVLHRAAPRSAPAARGLLGGRDHEPRVAAPARAVRVEALPIRRSGARRARRCRGWLVTRVVVAEAGRSRRTIEIVSPYNPANAVTASRFLALPPFVWAVHNGYHQYATLFMLVCGLL